jgi:hypothetical protein
LGGDGGGGGGGGGDPVTDVTTSSARDVEKISNYVDASNNDQSYNVQLDCYYNMLIIGCAANNSALSDPPCQSRASQTLCTAR